MYKIMFIKLGLLKKQFLNKKTKKQAMKIYKRYSLKVHFYFDPVVIESLQQSIAK